MHEPKNNPWEMRNITDLLLKRASHRDRGRKNMFWFFFFPGKGTTMEEREDGVLGPEKAQLFYPSWK